MKRLLRSKLFVTLTLFVLLAMAIVVPLSNAPVHSHAQGSVTITEFSIPTTNSGPFGITAGPDGNLWFTEAVGNQIGRVNLSSGIHLFNQGSLPALWA